MTLLFPAALMPSFFLQESDANLHMRSDIAENEAVALILRRSTFVSIARGDCLADVGARPALAAFYLGASAPIVLDKLAQGALPTIPAKISDE